MNHLSPPETNRVITNTLVTVKRTLEMLMEQTPRTPRTRRQRRRYIARPTTDRPAAPKLTKRAAQVLKFLDTRGPEGATSVMIQRRLHVNRNSVAGALHVLKTAQQIVTDLDVDPVSH